MVDNRLIVNQPLRPTNRVAEKKSDQNKTEKSPKPSFQQILQQRMQKQDNLKFSRHAEKRIISRGIDLSKRNLQQLNKGVDKAEKKGARESLIMVDQVAFLVSVENKTVITAVDEGHIKENVFTNIDSAVFM